VSSVDESILGPPDPEHPICPNCDVPMWMMKVENFGSGDEQRQHRIYECQLCGTKSIIDPWTLIAPFFWKPAVPFRSSRIYETVTGLDPEVHYFLTVETIRVGRAPCRKAPRPRAPRGAADIGFSVSGNGDGGCNRAVSCFIDFKS